MMQSYRGVHIFFPKEHSTMNFVTGSCAPGGSYHMYTFECTTLESRKTQLRYKAQTKDLIAH